MIQSFLNFWVNYGDICQFLFRDTGYFSKYLKGYVISGTPFQGPIYALHGEDVAERGGLRPSIK